MENNEKKDCGDCGCGHDHEQAHEHNHGHQVSVEELTKHNNFLLNVLIDLLVKKEVLSETEIRSRIEEIQSELLKQQQQ